MWWQIEWWRRKLIERVGVWGEVGCVKLTVVRWVHVVGVDVILERWVDKAGLGWDSFCTDTDRTCLYLNCMNNVFNQFNNLLSCLFLASLVMRLHNIVGGSTSTSKLWVWAKIFVLRPKILVVVGWCSCGWVLIEFYRVEFYGFCRNILTEFKKMKKPKMAGVVFVGFSIL